MTANTFVQILPLDGTKKWDFLNPDPSAIDWPTIALVLARTPRFNGHTTQGPYSVAQHLVEGARAILRDGYVHEVAAAYLLHDVHEFTIGDDVRPKVEALAALASQEADSEAHGRLAAKWLRSAFKELKRRADAVIYPAAGLPWPLDAATAEVVHRYDNRMLRTEADARTGPRCQAWENVVESAQPVEGADCSQWSADLAASLWLSLAKELLPALCAPPEVREAQGCDCCEPSVSPRTIPQYCEHPTVCESIAECSCRPSDAPSMQDLRGWPDSPAPRVEPRPALIKPITVLSGEKQDEQRYGNKRFMPQPDSPRDGVCTAEQNAAIDALTTKLAKAAGLAKERETSKADVRDWCDWADGGRPGTCTACGGVFGMINAPSTCHRGGGC